MEDPELRKTLPDLCVANFLAFTKCKDGFFDMRKRMRGNAPLSTGKYDDTYEKLSSGDFDPREEMRKLDLLNKNLARQREEADNAQ